MPVPPITAVVVETPRASNEASNRSCGDHDSDAGRVRLERGPLISDEDRSPSAALTTATPPDAPSPGPKATASHLPSGDQPSMVTVGSLGSRVTARSRRSETSMRRSPPPGLMDSMPRGVTTVSGPGIDDTGAQAAGQEAATVLRTSLSVLSSPTRPVGRRYAR